MAPLNDTQPYKVPGRPLASNPATQMVLDQYGRSRREVVDPKREMWEEFYESYRNSMSVPEDGLVTQLAIPLVYSNVEDFLARLAQTPRIEVWGRSPQDAPRANSHRVLMEYDWQLLNMTLKMIRIAKNAEVYGTCFLKTTHRKLIQSRLIRKTENIVVKLLDNVLGTSRRNNFIWDDLEIYNDPWVEVCEIDSIFPDPDGQTLDPSDPHQCRWLVHQTPITLAELKGARLDDEPLYIQSVVSKLEEMSKRANMKASTRSTHVTLRESALDLFDDRTSSTVDPYERQFTLLEYTSQDQIISVILEAPQLEPVRNEGNPLGFINFMEFTPIPDLHSLYGIAMPEVLGSLQFELQTLHGAAIDNILRRVHQMYTITRNSGINPNDIHYNPSGIVWVRRQGDIQPMPREPIDFSFARESQEIDRWAQKAMSTDTFSGLAVGGGGTATESNNLNANSASKAGLMLTVLSHQLLTPWGRQIMRTNELYMDSDRYGRIAGDDFGSQEQFEKVSPEDLVSGSGMDLGMLIDLAQPDPVNAAAKLQRGQAFIQALGQIGLPLEHPIFQAALLQMAQGMKLSSNPENLMFGDQAKEAIARQQAIAAAEAQPVAPGQPATTDAELLSGAVN